MAKTSSPHIKVNLSGKPKEHVENLFLKWSITSGKIVIIITELIALGALGYRFVVDKQIVDLHDQIARQELLLKNLDDKEKEYRGIQERLTMIKDISSETQTKLNLLNTILDAQSASIFTITNLVINQNLINISGDTISIFSLSNFIEDMKKNENVTSIAIDDITTGDTGIQFKLFIELKKEVVEKPVDTETGPEPEGEPSI